MNPDELLEQIKNAKWEFEEADKEVTKARQKKDKKLREFNRINQELYKRNVELTKKLKECEEDK